MFEGFWKIANLQAKSAYSKHAPATREADNKTKQSEKGGNAVEADVTGSGEYDDVEDGGTNEGASAQERLSGLDFQFIANPEQQREIEHLAEKLARQMRRKPSRRQLNRSSGRRLNMRKTLRDSLRYGGVPVNLSYRQKQPQQPKLVVIVDVSRSMSVYSSVFLRFTRGLVGAFRNVDAFAFHTKLVHITEALRQPDLVMVKHHLALISQGWSGGTRLGESLEYFNTHHGRSVNRRSVVVILSDGLETGSAEMLTKEVAHLKDRCRRLVWLNPLLGREGYETRTDGMLTVLPLLDIFEPAHNLESLAALEQQLIHL